jgi:RimJ/RimL family protein N-acetyltransferase
VVIDIPRLRTERLVLRGFEERDFEPYAAMMADPEVVRYLGDGRTLSRGRGSGTGASVCARGLAPHRYHQSDSPVE